MIPSATVPLVTIAIPTLNRAGFVGEAVRSALAQTHPNIEIIVSDNGSTDNTQAVLSAFADVERVNVLRRDVTVPMYEHWNFCLAQAKGQYFLLLSDDDVLLPQAVERLLAAIDSISPTCLAHGAAMAYARAEIVDGVGRRKGYTKLAPVLESGYDCVLGFLREQRTNYPACILLPTDAIRAVGGYQESRFQLAADAAVWMAIALRLGQVAFVETVSVIYREHSASATKLAVADRWIVGLRAIIDMLAEAPGAPAPWRRDIGRAGVSYIACRAANMACDRHRGLPFARLRLLRDMLPFLRPDLSRLAYATIVAALMRVSRSNESS